jgi:repressor LexA
VRGSGDAPDPSVLTQRQREVLEFILGCVEEHGAQPSLKVMLDHFGFTSANDMYAHIKALARKGFVRKHSDLRKRSLVLVGWKFRRVPVETELDQELPQMKPRRKEKGK